MERSLPKGNVRFSTGTFASQRGRSLPKGTVRFPKGTFAFQKERSLFKGNVACYYKRSKSLWKVSLFAMPFQPAHDGLHAEIYAITATEASARCFLMTRAILKPSMICSCATPMDMVTCSSSKSADLFIWKCPSCKKYKTIRTDSVLAGTKLSFQQFSSVIFYFSVRSLTNVEVAALTGISDKAVGDWRCILSNAVANWFLNNSTPLGGPGKIVEVDEAKFGKRKYNKGAYREGMWVLGGVDRETGNCFLVPCPGNRRTAAVLIPVIERWILPGPLSTPTSGHHTAASPLVATLMTGSTTPFSSWILSPASTPTRRRAYGIMSSGGCLAPKTWSPYFSTLCSGGSSTLVLG